MPSCPTSGCAVHRLPGSREIRCRACGERRWPSTIEPQDSATYVCLRCRAVPAETRDRRQKAARKPPAPGPRTAPPAVTGWQGGR
jgi:DNA-directed RNA polymerase subunit RPC12/RpoP